MLVQEGSSKPVVLRGINWFGWSVGSFNFDGMWVSACPLGPGMCLQACGQTDITEGYSFAH